MVVVFVVVCSHDYTCILELQISAALLVEERVFFWPCRIVWPSVNCICLSECFRASQGCLVVKLLAERCLQMHR